MFTGYTSSVFSKLRLSLTPAENVSYHIVDGKDLNLMVMFCNSMVFHSSTEVVTPPVVKRGRGRPKGSGKIPTKEYMQFLRERGKISKTIPTAIKKKDEKLEAQRAFRLERTKKIIEMREKGAAYETISREFNLTRERVRQILVKHAPSLACHMGAHDTLALEKRNARREAKQLKRQTIIAYLKTISKEAFANNTNPKAIRKQIKKQFKEDNIHLYELFEEICKTDPEFAAAFVVWKNNQLSEKAKRMWRNPETRKKIMTNLYENGHYEHTSEIMKKYWSDPEWKEKVLQSRYESPKWQANREKMRTANHVTPAAVKASKARMKELWNDPEKRKERLRLIARGVKRSRLLKLQHEVKSIEEMLKGESPV